ncbi:hypothetical protein ACSMX9_05950 [Streptomyces sp. LE64]|uniref:hypothetical protein n=1 Tax=Streptomyces sp. LE64 TaxID=3448653 RepID=UPI0040432587
MHLDSNPPERDPGASRYTAVENTVTEERARTAYTVLYSLSLALGVHLRTMCQRQEESGRWVVDLGVVDIPSTERLIELLAVGNQVVDVQLPLVPGAEGSR